MYFFRWTRCAKWSFQNWAPTPSGRVSLSTAQCVRCTVCPSRNRRRARVASRERTSRGTSLGWERTSWWSFLIRRARRQFAGLHGWGCLPSSLRWSSMQVGPLSLPRVNPNPNPNPLGLTLTPTRRFIPLSEEAIRGITRMGLSTIWSKMEFDAGTT